MPDGFHSEGEACIAHRRRLRKQGVLATFTCQGEGHWTSSPLSAKIVVDESKKARTLCFVGDLHREQCVVLELLTQHLVLTKWDHLASRVRVKVDPKSFAYPMEVSADDLRREQLAIEGGEVSRPSLGQQVAGEAKQVEFTLTRRGRDFILRLGERVAYRGARGGPKSCRLGRVTQVDQARAQVGVHRYLPEVSGVRIKWALAYLKEDGSMTSSEGSRPSIETVSVKEVITKVDLNRDGVLAASSARKLDKAGADRLGCSEG